MSCSYVTWKFRWVLFSIQSHRFQRWVYWNLRSTSYFYEIIYVVHTLGGCKQITKARKHGGLGVCIARHQNTHTCWALGKLIWDLLHSSGTLQEGFMLEIGDWNTIFSSNLGRLGNLYAILSPLMISMTWSIGLKTYMISAWNLQHCILLYLLIYRI
jgi:hypothetical protein